MACHSLCFKKGCNKSWRRRRMVGRSLRWLITLCLQSGSSAWMESEITQNSSTWSVTHFLQQTYTSQRLHNFPKWGPSVQTYKRDTFHIQTRAFCPWTCRPKVLLWHTMHLFQFLRFYNLEQLQYCPKAISFESPSNPIWLRLHQLDTSEKNLGRDNLNWENAPTILEGGWACGMILLTDNRHGRVPVHCG